MDVPDDELRTHPDQLTGADVYPEPIVPLRPADALPAGLIACGPNGTVTPADLTDEDSLTVRLFAAWAREHKAIKAHYDPLIAAATPGTREYTRLADERTQKLRQLNDQYEAASVTPRQP